MKKRLISLLAAAALLVAAIPAPALAVEGEVTAPAASTVQPAETPAEQPAAEPAAKPATEPATEPAAVVNTPAAEDAPVVLADGPVRTADDLKKAVASAEDSKGTTVTLGAEITLDAPLEIPAGKNIVLDLNGFTLSSSATGENTGDVINNKGTLTVKNGTVAAADKGAGTWGMAVNNCTGAVLTVAQDEGFTTRLVGRSGIANEGSATVLNGKVESYNRNAYWGQGGSTLLVEDGVFTALSASSGMGRAISTEGNVTIHGGSFYAGGSVGAGDNYVNAIGMFYDAQLLIEPAAGKTVTVTSETDYAVATRYGAKAVIKGGSFACEGDRVDLKNIDDEYTGCFEVTGGTFRHEPAAEYLGDGCVVVPEGSGFAVKQVQAPTDLTVNTYEELAAALNGDILQPKNITVGANVQIPAGARLTLKNGYTLTVPAGKTLTVDGVLSLEGAMTNAGTLTVSANGFVEHPLKLTNTGSITGFPTVENGVCKVSTPMELQWVSCMVEWNNDNIPARIELANDIVMPAVEFTPIGNSESKPFHDATFDGCGHTVSGLKIVAESGYRGGFLGYVNGALVQNLTLADGSTTSTSSYIGSVAGLVTGNTTFLNVNVKNYEVSSPVSYGVGGFVGQISDTNAANRVEFINCKLENSSVTGYANVGGIWGTSTGSLGTIGIYNSSVSGTVEAINVNGGVCGGFGNSAPVQIIGLDNSSLTLTVKDAPSDKLVSASDASKQDIANVGSENTAIKNDKGEWVVKGDTPETTAVASINGVDYTSINAAVNAANPGDVITLLANATEDVVVPEGKNVTLDLAGKILNLKGEQQYDPKGNVKAKMVGIVNHGSLTIQNGVVAWNKAFSGIANTGTLNIASNATLSSTVTSWDGSCLIFNVGGNVTTAGSLSSTANEGIMTYGGSVNVTGGRITAKNANASCVTIFNREYNNESAGANVVISGGKLESGDFTVSTNNLYSGGENGSNLTITGGELVSDITAVYWPSAGTLTIGTEDSTNGPTITAKGGSAVEVCSGTLNVYGGTLKGGTEHADKDSITTTSEWVEAFRAKSGASCIGDAITVIARRGGGYVSAPLNVTIAGGTFTSDQNYAVRFMDCNTTENADQLEQAVSAGITGGSFSGKIAAVDASFVKADEQKIIDGGTFSNDPTAYLTPDSQVVKNADGTFGVQDKPAVTPTPKPEEPWTPNPTPTPTPVPAPTATPKPAATARPKPTATPAPTEAPAEATPTPEPAEPTPTPAPTEAPAEPAGTDAEGGLPILPIAIGGIALVLLILVLVLRKLLGKKDEDERGY